MLKTERTHTILVFKAKKMQTRITQHSKLYVIKPAKLRIGCKSLGEGGGGDRKK